jgi:hypothetical protein
MHGVTATSARRFLTRIPATMTAAMNSSRGASQLAGKLKARLLDAAGKIFVIPGKVAKQLFHVGKVGMRTEALWRLLDREYRDRQGFPDYVCFSAIVHFQNSFVAPLAQRLSIVRLISAPWKLSGFKGIA